MILGAAFDWWEFWEWSPAAWGAIGAIGALVYAAFQVGQARKLREEQARPWVVVDFEPDWIMWLTIENTGRTVATDVKLRFTPELASTQTKPWPWEESPAFTEGIPSLPPRKRLRFFFDSLPARLNDQTLPKHYDVFIEYHGPIKRRKPLTSTYKLDIGHYWGSSPPPKGLPELVKEVENIHKEMKKWTDGTSGLQVNATDRNDQERRLHRPFRIPEAKQIKESDGWLALGRHSLKRALHRRGWYSR